MKRLSCITSLLSSFFLTVMLHRLIHLSIYLSNTHFNRVSHHFVPKCWLWLSTLKGGWDTGLLRAEQLKNWFTLLLDQHADERLDKSVHFLCKHHWNHKVNVVPESKGSCREADKVLLSSRPKKTNNLYAQLHFLEWTKSPHVFLASEGRGKKKQKKNYRVKWSETLVKAFGDSRLLKDLIPGLGLNLLKCWNLQHAIMEKLCIPACAAAQSTHIKVHAADWKLLFGSYFLSILPSISITCETKIPERTCIPWDVACRRYSGDTIHFYQPGQAQGSSANKINK